MEDTYGQVWLSTIGSGIYIFNSNSKTFKQIFDTIEQNNNLIFNLYRDEANRIWMGRQLKGFTMINLKDSTQSDLSIRPGVAEYFPNSIGFIDNNIYFLTNNGLTSFATPDKVISGQSQLEFKNYETSTGGINNLAITYASVFPKRGEIWWGMGDHIEIFKPSIEDNYLPNTQLTGIDIQSTTQHFIDRNRLVTRLINANSSKLPDSLKVENFKLDSLVGPYDIPVNLKLPNDMNLINFHFISSESDNLDKPVYRYFLKGRDKKWSDISDKPFSQSYIDLQPEDYVFKVASRSFDRIWGKPEEFQFTILPPWWKTLPAYLSYLILALSIAYFLYRNHLRRLQTRQKNEIKAAIQTQEDERKRISRDLHDDIGTKLSALKLFLSSLEEKAMATNNKEIGSMAQISEQYIKEVVNDLRQLLMNLSPLVLEEFGYVVAVEGLANKINETNLIQFTLNVFGFKQRIQKDYELYLYRITQELISNILKHADARNISLEVGIRDEKIILIMADDGKGFNFSQKNGGYGLKNLETRTKIMSGKMIIESKPGKGTIVLIEIPYNLT